MGRLTRSPNRCLLQPKVRLDLYLELGCARAYQLFSAWHIRGPGLLFNRAMTLYTVFHLGVVDAHITDGAVISRYIFFASWYRVCTANIRTGRSERQAMSLQSHTLLVSGVKGSYYCCYSYPSGMQVTAVAYDNPIPGFGTRNTINLRLWASRPDREFDLEAFNTGDYVQVREAGWSLFGSLGINLPGVCFIA
jgi:hypothetical protein